MINDTHFDYLIGQRLLKANKEKEEKHKSTGKLSAGSLGQPLQWQILHHYGIPTPAFDEYTLRKFLRGNQIEDWVVKELEDEKIVVSKQQFLEYNGVIGYNDIIIKHNGQVPQLRGLEIPHEVKSVTNMKFKRITRSKEADPQHKLQAGLYALALKSDWFAVDYIASDDLRLETYIYKTETMKEEIDKIIGEYNKALATGKIPPFGARYTWQENPKYSNYPDWMNLTQKELDIKFKKLKGGE